MNLFEICTVTRAVLDDDWDWTGALELDYEFAYSNEEIKNLEFMSLNNDGIFKIWD